LLYADDLQRLVRADAGKPRLQGWKLTPQSIVQFVLGDETLAIKPKFVGKRSFVERCIVALAAGRGLMLIGEPGTAKSWLSELIAAAICGDSTLTIQGSAGTEPKMRSSIRGTTP
jgi:MoxR-like ATPase